MGFFDWLDRLVCANHYETEQILRESLKKKDETIANLQASIEKLENELKLYTSSESELQEKIKDLEKQKQILENEISKLNEIIREYELGGIPEDVASLIEYYDKKYPPATIAYSGRYLPNWGNYSVDVKVFAACGMNDYNLYDHVKKAKAFVKDIINEKGCSFHEACDEAVLRIARSTPILYQYDYANYNVDEYWMFAPETYKVVYDIRKGADCDDYAHMRHVLCRIAGVPAGLLRVVCGDTKGNLGGHATNYYLKSDGEWWHINSTSNIYDYNDWRKKDDPNDNIGIGKVWFSYNDLNSWSVFKTDAAEKSYFENKNKLTKYITIIRYW
jgi:chaperonin cofactor prefoldin